MSASHHELQILLVEDDPADAEMTIDALRDGNVVNRVLWVKDGAEALDLMFGRAAYDGEPPPNLKLVLLDLHLPRVDGLEVLRQLRADERTRRLPVVILTSSRLESDVRMGYEFGVNSYLVKPVDSVAFFLAVRDLGLYWILLNRTPGETS
jgi:two-component system, response regulator